LSFGRMVLSVRRNTFPPSSRFLRNVGTIYRNTSRSIPQGHAILTFLYNIKFHPCKVIARSGLTRRNNKLRGGGRESVREREICCKVKTRSSTEIPAEPETTCKQHTGHWTAAANISVSYQRTERRWKKQN